MEDIKDMKGLLDTPDCEPLFENLYIVTSTTKICNSAPPTE